MANQGSKPNLDGISRTKSVDGMVRPATQPAPEPPVTSRPARKQVVSARPKSVPEPAPPPVVAAEPVAAPAVTFEPQPQLVAQQPEKKALMRKLIKVVIVLAVLVALGAGIWWVYLSYFA